MSTHILAAEEGVIAETVLLPGDPLRAKFIAENYLENAVQYNDIRNMYGYTGTYKGVPISVQGTGMGMPSMGIYSWELITCYGVKNLIRVGTAGSFDEKIKLGDIVVALTTSTDSNYVHTFDLPGTLALCCSEKILRNIINVCDENNMNDKVHFGNVISCDVFYEIMPDWWKRWKKMGIMAVEMEAAALYMNAVYNNVNAAAIVTISDHFVTGEQATTIQREQEFTDMMELALETAIRL